MGFLSRLFSDCGTVRFEGITESGQEVVHKGGNNEISG